MRIFCFHSMDSWDSKKVHSSNPRFQGFLNSNIHWLLMPQNPLFSYASYIWKVVSPKTKFRLTFSSAFFSFPSHELSNGFYWMYTIWSQFASGCRHAGQKHTLKRDSNAKLCLIQRCMNVQKMKHFVHKHLFAAFLNLHYFPSQRNLHHNLMKDSWRLTMSLLLIKFFYNRRYIWCLEGLRWQDIWNFSNLEKEKELGNDFAVNLGFGKKVKGKWKTFKNSLGGNSSLWFCFPFFSTTASQLFMFALTKLNCVLKNYELVIPDLKNFVRFHFWKKFMLRKILCSPYIDGRRGMISQVNIWTFPVSNNCYYVST